MELRRFLTSFDNKKFRLSSIDGIFASRRMLWIGVERKAPSDIRIAALKVVFSLFKMIWV